LFAWRWLVVWPEKTGKDACPLSFIRQSMMMRVLSPKGMAKGLPFGCVSLEPLAVGMPSPSSHGTVVERFKASLGHLPDDAK
jgi:hypothetical protein